MSVIRIASRYAKSLLDLAKDQNAMDEVVSDMEGFSKMVENRDLYLLLKSPIIKIGKKAEIFELPLLNELLITKAKLVSRFDTGAMSICTITCSTFRNDDLIVDCNFNFLIHEV